MGQKVNPNGLRLGINRDWSSHWYADKKTFSVYLKEDIAIRNYLESKLNSADAGLSHIDIDRVKNKIKVIIHTSRPGIVIGKNGENLKALRAGLSENIKKANNNIVIDVVEINRPDLDAVLVAKDIAKQLEQRMSNRVVQKKAIQRVMKAGALGVKVMSKGRIGGAEIARYEEHREGVLSLHTLSQPIDYAHVDAHTTYGVIGVKVWIALPENYEQLLKTASEDTRGRRQPRRNFNRNHPQNQERAVAPAATPNPDKDKATSAKGE